jgi:predicted MFS family arabinose efflux permease
LGAGLSVFQSTLPNFGLFLASRALEGVSHLLIVVAAPTVLGQITEARHRAATMTLWSTFFAVSYAVFLWGGVPLVAHFGLAALFLCHAVAMVLLAVFVWRMLPDDAIPRSTQTLTARVVLARHITAYTSPHIAAPAAGWLFYATGFVALVTVLPEFFTGPWRHALSGFLPLVTMMVSMTFGIILVRRYTPVPVVIAGFLLAFGFAASLAFGVPVAGAGLCVLGAAGLVQAGSFSAIPQLNAQPQDQALANGAMAQLGNAGNMVGTPILLVLTQAYGLPGLIGFALVAFGGGACVHIWLAQLRSKEL